MPIGFKDKSDTIIAKKINSVKSLTKDKLKNVDDTQELLKVKTNENSVVTRGKGNNKKVSINS